MPAPKGHAPYNVNGEGGRPLKYTEKYVNELADKLEEWIKEKENVFIERFCLKYDVPEEAISTDLINFERFSKVYKKFKTKQKVDLCEGSLKRRFAHPMCALILSNHHNMHLKTEQKVTGDALNPLSFIVSNIDGSTKDLVDG